MNKLETKRKRIEIMKKYHTPGGQNYVKRAKNAVYVSAANLIEHEVGKLVVGWLLKKAKREFITEAVRNKGEARKVDLVDLDGHEVEIVLTNGDLERYQREGVTAVMVKGLVSIDLDGFKRQLTDLGL